MKNSPRGRPSLLFLIDRTKPASLQAQLLLDVKRLVHNGTLRPGDAVPSSRELAHDLQISRNTVLQAYERLIGEGYLETSTRRGLYVSASLNERSLRKAPLGDGITPAGREHGFRDNEAESCAPVPFRPCQPDVRLFPLAQWNRARTRALHRHGAGLLHYRSQQPLGLPALRRSLAAYLQASRGVRCDWRQIAITTGSQQALFLLAHLLIAPGDSVAMEDPGYLGARLSWQYVRANIQPVGVDSDGMKLDDLKGSPTLVYTTPSRQFPIGSCLSLRRRLELVDFASKKKAWILEDDYDSEFRYSRAPLPSLQSLDPFERVIYVGSTSKALFPSLRIGYAVIPSPLIEKFETLRMTMDEHGPLVDQATLAEFIEGGAFYRHIRRSRREYAKRLETFIESARKLDVPVRFPYTDGGMNLSGFLESGVKDTDCSRRLLARGLEVPALSRYSLRAASSGLLFGFTAFEPGTIKQSMKVVARTLQGAKSR